MSRNSLGLIVLLVALLATWQPAAAQLINGDFETGDLTGWTSFTTPNGNITPGFPMVTPFDTTGDGTASNAMKIRVGQNSFVPTPAGGGIEQFFSIAASGDYELSLDYAIALEQTNGNTEPGRFDLILDGQVIATGDHNSQTIWPGDVIRGSLSAEVLGLAAGGHTLQVLVTRATLNTREVYQYVDNVTITPEPGTLFLLGLGTLALIRRRS